MEGPTGTAQECVRNRRILSAQLKRLLPAFAALGDENRQQIFVTLLESETWGMRVGQITESTHLSRPAVSHHLQIMLRAGLVEVDKRGTRNYYAVSEKLDTWAALKGLFDDVYVVATAAARERKTRS
ncbi:MAG: metalloregulator ArsR/SmtB family transcription factor [Atopobiaceae bacterium]